LIPLIDLRKQHLELADEILAAVQEIVHDAAFVGGPQVRAFESEWAAFCGAQDAVGVASGTDAIRVMLIASGIRQGDEVVTAPFTFAATLEAIIQAGAQPVLVDIDPESGTLDPSKIEAVITSRTRGILPVHLYGHPADMDLILEIAARDGLLVFEDAAQAHGATYKGRKAGSLARAAAFSFYPAKNLGACGEAGSVTTDDPRIAHRIRMLRDHGQAEKNIHDMQGYNGKLDAIQAAVLRIKLRRLTQWNKARSDLAELYGALLRDIPGLTLPCEAASVRSAWHLYVIRSPRREELREKLARCGIATAVHYPHPVHVQRSFAFLGHQAGDFPVSERWAREVLSIPMYPELEPDQVRFICRQIREILR
jgi:dTDP-4-amino-4,6-dideoxygalactose transaminase